MSIPVTFSTPEVPEACPAQVQSWPKEEKHTKKLRIEIKIGSLVFFMSG
jgi:hypothetical protein